MLGESPRAQTGQRQQLPQPLPELRPQPVLPLPLPLACEEITPATVLSVLHQYPHSQGVRSLPALVRTPTASVPPGTTVRT